MSFLWGCCDCDKKKDFLPQVKVSEKDQKEMVLIPSGEFIMGTNKFDNEDTHKKIGAVKPLYLDQHPERKLFWLDTTWIDMKLLTKNITFF